MAGSLSSHLVEGYLNSSRSTGPFGVPLPYAGPSINTSIKPEPDLIVSGATSYDRNMHGNVLNRSQSMPGFLQDDSSYVDMSEATAMKIAALQAKLNQKLGPEYISTRPGPSGGPKLIYAEGWKVINLANEVFGFNGWSSSITSLTTDFIDYNQETKRFNVGVTAIVRVTLRDGVYHEDVGYGLLENSKSKGMALDKCRKEAVTDGLKRALRNFGNLLGNCLYDKSYTQEVVKIKVQPPKFDANELHRRPEFTEKKPAVPSTTPITTTSSSTSTSVEASNANTHTRKYPTTSSTDNNIENESISNAAPQPNYSSTTCPKTSVTTTPYGRVNHNPNGLNTPITTPASHHHPQQQQKLQTSTSSSSNHNHHRNNANASTKQSSVSRTVTFETPQPQRLSNANTSAPPPHAPPPHAPQETPSETLHEEDSFTINSEDDVFYAMVDLGEDEGDTGRPIVQEEVEDENSNEGTVDPPPPPPNANKQSSSRFAAIGAALAGLPGTSSSSSSGASSIFRQQEQDGRQEQQRQAQRVPLKQEPYSGNLNHGANVNRYRPPDPKPSPPPSFSGPGMVSSTPKRGGFSFPPNILNQGRQSSVPPQVGIKRSADTMRSSSAINNNAHNSYSRRPAQGMGLMAASGMAPDGGDGDAKRMKR